MSFYEDTSSSPIDLLQKIVVWLVSIGWVQDMSQGDGAGWRAHLHKGSTYINFRAMVNEKAWLNQDANAYGLAFYVGTGFSSGADWRSQVGGPIGSGTSSITGVSCATAAGTIPGFKCFSDAAGDNVILVVERVVGVFTYLSWGAIEKAGAWTGGAYFGGSRSGFWANDQIGTSSPCPFSYGDLQQCGNYFVRADVDTFTGKWVSPCIITRSWYQGLTGGVSLSPIQTAMAIDSSIPGYGLTYEARQFSDMNGLAILLPIHLYAKRDAAVGGASLLGQVPGIYRTIATSKGFAVGSPYLLGADTYLLFPGFAVKKVP